MVATSRAQRTLLVVLLALLVAIVAVLVTDRGTHQSRPAVTRSQFDGPAMPPGLRAAGFALRDQDGRLVSLSQYRGQVVVLTFIHSRCHDACPFMVEQIKGALGDLGAGGRTLPVIGVSVAPSEDTVASRRAFLAKHQMTDHLAFVSGTRAQLQPIWHAYAIQPVTPKIDHSTFVLLVDRRGIERVGFPADQLTPEGLAHDIRVLQRERA